MKIPSYLLIMTLIGIGSASADSIFGEAGHDRCGIGTMLWGDGSSVVTQSSEASSNASSGGTFSITTGTSGCKSSGLVKATQEELFYTNVNFEELKFDLAYGSGEHLEGLISTLGCEDAGADFRNVSKLNYAEIISGADSSPEMLLRNIKNMIRLNRSLSSNCRTII